MLNNILSVSFSISILYIFVEIFNFYIDGVTDYYKKYTYMSFLRDFILATVTIIISYIIVNVFSMNNIVLFVLLLIILNTMFSVSFSTIFNYLPFDNNFVKSFVDLSKQQLINFTLKDLLVLFISLFVNLIFSYIGYNTSVIITLLSISVVMFNIYAI